MKLAVWGLGKHAIKNILPAVQENKKLELYGVLSRNTRVVNECKKNFQCLSWESPEEMLKDKQLKVVYVSTPPGLHFEQGIKILKANKHFWCEKPLTTNLSDSKTIVDLSIKKELTVCEAFMYQYHPQFLQFKELLDKGLIGKIKSVYCRFGLPKLDSPGYRGDLSLGASSLLDIGSYTLSSILNLFPNKEITIINYKKIPKASKVIDFEGRVELNIDKSIDCNLEWAYNRSYRNEIDVWGDKGSLYTEKVFSKESSYKPSIIVKDLKGKKSKIEVEPANHFHLMLESFVESVHKEDKLNYQREQIINLMKLIHTLRGSVPKNL